MYRSHQSNEDKAGVVVHLWNFSLVFLCSDLVISQCHVISNHATLLSNFSGQWGTPWPSANFPRSDVGAHSVSAVNCTCEPFSSDKRPLKRNIDYLYRVYKASFYVGYSNHVEISFTYQNKYKSTVWLKARVLLTVVVRALIQSLLLLLCLIINQPMMVQYYAETLFKLWYEYSQYI